MRLPTRSELSEEQEAIFLKAPFSGTVVIIGAPGTGKTVLAVYRSYLLSKKKAEFKLIMYNRVLRSYTETAMTELELGSHVSTKDSWIYHWWYAGFRHRFPYQNKQPDYVAAIREFASGVSQPKQLNWGHLLVDEGQDFPKAFYTLLRMVMDGPDVAVPAAPSITVLADENQRLNPEHHSSIAEICSAMNVSKPYKLTKNFRNTYEIAKLAGSFYVGSRSEIPDLPDGRHGSKPVLRSFSSMSEELDHIFRYAKLNDDQVIGVLVPTDYLRKQVVSGLKKLTNGSQFKVSTYAGYMKNESSLDFHSGGNIMVLCEASCKGLEFDAVFIPQLQMQSLEGVSEDFVKMRLYVMCSRARSYLSISYTDCEAPPDVVKVFPQPDAGILEWRK